LQVLRFAFPLNGRHTAHPGILRCGLSIPSLASPEYWVARRRTLENLTKNFYPVTAMILSGITGRAIALASGATADVNYSSTDFGAVPATQRGAR
jgi:hypothetical protein